MLFKADAFPVVSPVQEKNQRIKTNVGDRGGKTNTSCNYAQSPGNKNLGTVHQATLVSHLAAWASPALGATENPADISLTQIQTPSFSLCYLPAFLTIGLFGPEYTSLVCRAKPLGSALAFVLPCGSVSSSIEWV